MANVVICHEIVVRVLSVAAAVVPPVIVVLERNALEVALHVAHTWPWPSYGCLALGAQRLPFLPSTWRPKMKPTAIWNILLPNGMRSVLSWLGCCCDANDFRRRIGGDQQKAGPGLHIAPAPQPASHMHLIKWFCICCWQWPAAGGSCILSPLRSIRAKWKMNIWRIFCRPPARASHCRLSVAQASFVAKLGNLGFFVVASRNVVSADKMKQRACAGNIHSNRWRAVHVKWYC